MGFTRRDFLSTASALAVARTLEAKDERTGMPMRVLGSTGQKVSVLGIPSAAASLRIKRKIRRSTR